MKPSKCHFPFFLVALIAMFCLSCNRNEVDNKEDVHANRLIDTALAQLDKQDFQKAFYYFNQAFTVSNNNDNKVYALIRMANIQITVCDFAEAEASITKAIEINRNPKNNYYLYNTLGIAYLEQLNFEAALYNYDKSYQNGQNALDKLIVKNNIGVVYLDKKDFNKAIKVLEPLTQTDSFKVDHITQAKILDNLGYAYFKTKNPKALNYLKQSLAIRNELENDFEKNASLMHLAEYYQNTDPDLALMYGQKAYQTAHKINSPDDKLEALKFMIANSEPESAKQLALQQIKLSDSINRVRQSAKNQFAKIKYDSKKAIENQLRYKNKMQLAFGITLIILVSGLVLVYILRKRNREKVKATVYETENRIAKKIHDELANDVFQTMAFAETQDLQNPQKKETLMDNLDNIYSKARDISKTNSEIQTGENFGDFLSELLNSFNSDEINVIIKNGAVIDWNKINKESKIAIYRVVQELMVNMKKHSEANLVVVSFEYKSKSIALKYSDNGKGMENQKISKKGLLNAENRIQALKGTFTFDKGTTKGLRVTIQIPK